MRVGSIDVPSRNTSSYIEDHGIVIAVAVVVRVGYGTEAGIKSCGTGDTRGGAVVHLADQVARKRIDIHPIRNISDGVAIAHYVVGVGPVVADAGRELASQLPLQ